MRQLRPSCSVCIYWVIDASTNPATSGHCHRYPPHVIISPTTGTVVQKFPTTDHHHWCGEWNGDERHLVAQARQAVIRAAIDDK